MFSHIPSFPPSPVIIYLPIKIRFLHLLADKNCNTGGGSLRRPHRSCTVISLTELRLPHSPEVSLSQICFIAPCNCYIFCPISLAPYLCFNVLLQHFLTFHPVINQGRYVMAHLLSGSAYPHVLYAIQYSVVKVHVRIPRSDSGKGHRRLFVMRLQKPISL